MKYTEFNWGWFLFPPTDAILVTKNWKSNDFCCFIHATEQFWLKINVFKYTLI